MIELEPISEEAIAEQSLELNEVWMVKLGEDIYGPFHTNELKAYALQHADQMADAEVTTMANEAWVLYLQSPLRPVKKKEPPKLVSATTLSKKNSYHYERHGHRHGPHSFDEISHLITEGKLLPTDLISDDEGFTWNKVYHLKEFELRPHKAEQLPFAPTEEALGRGHGEALHALMEAENPLEEGLVSLAYYGHRKAGTALKLEEVSLPKETSIPTIKPPPRSWWIGGGAAATAALALMIWWAQSPAPQSLEITSVEESSALIEEAPQGRSLLNNNNASSAPRRMRSPASLPPSRFSSPGAMTDSRRELMDYRESHRDAQDHPTEPMDADPYAADSQMVQNDAAMRQPAEAPDDGYRMEEPAAVESGPIVEEVGDF